jgi:predicted DCC family thiol-disulfide oxidoreductase YuxK
MSSGRFSVFFDGGCPLCAREIAFMRRLPGAATIHWVDLSASVAPEVVPGLSRCDAMARMHVRTSGGQLVSGGAAFAALWRQLPLTRPLGWLFSFGWTAALLDRLYDRFLRARPRLHALIGVRRSG